MSSNQSERAENRVGDLRESTLDRLRAHPELVTLLEQAEGVSDATEVIMPAPRIAVQHQSDSEEPPEVAVGVSIVTGSSERENMHERKHLVVQTTTQLTERALKWLGDAWLDDIKDEISSVMTAHEEPWVARGASGGTFEPLFDDDINRFVSVQQFDIMSWG